MLHHGNNIAFAGIIFVENIHSKDAQIVKLPFGQTSSKD